MEQSKIIDTLDTYHYAVALMLHLYLSEHGSGYILLKWLLSHASLESFWEYVKWDVVMSTSYKSSQKMIGI